MFFEAFQALTGLSFLEITKVRKVTVENLKPRAMNRPTFLSIGNIRSHNFIFSFTLRAYDFVVERVLTGTKPCPTFKVRDQTLPVTFICVNSSCSSAYFFSTWAMELGI